MNEPINYGWFEKDLEKQEKCAIQAFCEKEYERTGKWPVCVCMSCSCPKCRINC